VLPEIEKLVVKAQEKIDDQNKRET